MAVTLTVIEAAADRRLGDGVNVPAEPINGVLSRLLATATAIVENYAPNAPESVMNTAASLILGYLYDAPVGDSTRFANALANSGAQLVLSRWQSRNIVIVDGAGTSIPSAVWLDNAAVAALIATHAGLPTAHHIPPVGGLDAAAVAALIAAHTGVATAHHVPPVGGGGGGGGLGAAAVAALIATHAASTSVGTSESSGEVNTRGPGRLSDSGLTIPANPLLLISLQGDAYKASPSVVLRSELMAVQTSTSDDPVRDNNSIRVSSGDIPSSEIGTAIQLAGTPGNWRQTGVGIPADDFYLEVQFNLVWQMEQRINRARLMAIVPVVVGQARGGYIQLADVDEQQFYISRDSDSKLVIAAHSKSGTLGVRLTSIAEAVRFHVGIHDTNSTLMVATSHGTSVADVTITGVG